MLVIAARISWIGDEVELFKRRDAFEAAGDAARLVVDHLIDRPLADEIAPKLLGRRRLDKGGAEGSEGWQQRYHLLDG